MGMPIRIGFAVFACSLLASVAARADVIDGAWCHEGLRLTISGPAIVTPGGTKTSGDYSRHAFSYVVPASEPQPGTTVMMRLLNEETMNLRASPEAPWETWRRCGPPIS
jgi:hypothetical protein